MNQKDYRKRLTPVSVEEIKSDNDGVKSRWVEKRIKRDKSDGEKESVEEKIVRDERMF